MTWVPIRVGIRVPIGVGIRVVVGVPIRVPSNPTKQFHNRRAESAENSDLQLHVMVSPGAYIGLGAAGTLHPAAFGRCPHPAGIPPGPTDAGVKVVPPRRDANGGDGQAATGGCGRSTLTPGRAGWSR